MAGKVPKMTFKGSIGYIYSRFNPVNRPDPANDQRVSVCLSGSLKNENFT